MQNRIDLIGNKIDNFVLLLSKKVNDNRFTIASAVMILFVSSYDCGLLDCEMTEGYTFF
ncbi:hypothetical protein WAF17_22435 (plasmid) [Bernardetia sp. ABR2-2B]|uniref:hypothetical protein n=1 Tax=Bernardetia sp. ABR2-2B TaxID=3127472 RepID=UPI0030CDA2D5